MKISKLLVLSALWLAAGSAMATIVNGVRQKPVPTTQGFEVSANTNTYYYLYNVDAKAFFTEGNAWGTQASIGAEGLKVAFTQVSEGVYHLNDYSLAKKAWKQTFFDSTTAMFVDRGGQANYGWSVKDNGATFLLHAASVESGINPDLNSEAYPNKYVGLDVTENAANTALSPFLSDSVTHYITWALVTEEDYQNYQTLWNSVKDVFNKAAELKAVIDEAKAKNIDVSTQEAVYMNEEATIEDLEAAIAAVSAAIAAQIEGSVENPTLMTNLVNGSFDEASSAGWSGTAPNMTGDGKHKAANVPEHYNKTFDTYQNLSGMPKGVFRLNAKTFYRGSYGEFTSGVKSHAYIYAAANGDTLTTPFKNAWSAMNTESFVSKYGSTTYFNTPIVEGKTTDNDVTYYIPDNPSTFRLYYEEEGKNYYDTNLFFSVEEGNVMTVGLKKDVAVGGDWSVFDEFKLYYYGNAADAYSYWAEEVVKGLFDVSSIKDDAIYTESYLTDYQAILASTNASNRAEVLTIIENGDSAVAALKKNIALWEQLQKVIAEAIEVGADETLDPTYTSPLSEWAEFDVEFILAAHDMTNDALETLIKEKKDAIAEARLHVIGAGADVTNLLTNPDFSKSKGEQDWTGWTKDAASGGNVRVLESCAEAWNNSQFDIYQVVENAPVGVYEISVQGFYRYGRSSAYTDYAAQSVDYVKPNGSPCFVYMNAKATPFMNIFEEIITEDNYTDIYKGSTNYSDYTAGDGTHYYTPNGMEGAARCFASPSTVTSGSNMYTQRAFGLVAKEGDAMRIGVKGSSNQLGDSWVIFDNFKLTWWGFDKTEYIQPVLEEELVKAKENVDKTMGKDAYEHLSTAIANAETALQGTEGKVMFDALSALFDVDAEVTASVEAFKGLDAALALLNEEMGLHSDSPAIEDASNLMDEITGNISNHTYTDADVEALIAKINEMVVKLRIPAGDPTDAAPVDFSEVITNATYDENLDGWTCEAKDKDDNAKNPARNANYSNVELFGCNYDYYQEIAGLPAGIYRVGVTGFFRAGSVAEEWAHKDSVKYSRAFIYAIGENGTMNNKALTRLAENYVESSAVENGYAVAKTDTVDLGAEIFNYTLLANTMDAAGDLFAQDKYVPDAVTGEGNVVTVKVGEDGKLRFGLYKKVALSNNDWTIWANWKLWYFGTNSANQPSGDNDQYEEEQGIAVLNLDKAVRVETFTLDGRKVTSKKRGIVIQRMTMPDGSSVVIKKIGK